MDNQNKEVKMSEKCLNCKFWKADASWVAPEGEKAGVCKRYPLNQKKSSEDWCGEFEKEKVKRSGVFGRGEKE